MHLYLKSRITSTKQGCENLPAERKIYSIPYYSVKKDAISYCAQCGKKIPIITPAYAKGNKDKGEIFCRECIITLFDQYQYEEYGRIPFPEDALLYIGTLGHTCTQLNESTYSIRTAIFRHNKKSAYLPVTYCQKCKRFFVEKKEYLKNASILTNYQLVDTISGKPIPGSRNWTIESNLAPEEEPEYPPSVIWAYQHPFQGGGCNGK